MLRTPCLCCSRNVASHNAGHSKAVLKGQVNVSQAEFERIALGQVKELWTNYGQLGESESSRFYSPGENY
jgi:hypothetical protein